VQALAAGLPVSLFEVGLLRLSYEHNIAAASNGIFGPAPSLAIFVDRCGDHLVAPGADDIVVYQPAVQPTPCLAGALNAWQECTVIGGTDTAQFSSATGVLPPGFSLADYITATSTDCSGAGALFPAFPNPAFGLLVGGDASFSDIDAAVDHAVIKAILPALSPIPDVPADEIIFDFEADCSKYGGDADGDCLCDGPPGSPTGFPTVLNADRCPNDPTNDPDGDGVCQDVDNCPDTYNPDQADADGDGIGDACDPCTDTDGDGFGNPGFAANTCAVDNCPTTYNPDQADGDGDGIGDACDACPTDNPNDPDGDGICQSVDNCPTIANPGQEDLDGDGIGNACDPVDSTAFTLSGADLLKHFPNKDRWSARGKFDTTGVPTFADDVDNTGISASIERFDGTLIDGETWTGAECAKKNNGASLRCRNANGSVLRLVKQHVPNVYKVVVTVQNQSFVLPNFVQVPLRVKLTAAGSIDWVDEIDHCVPASAFKKMVCREAS
jgi:hypothetical protein